MSLIALVRHGETDYNRNLIIQGRFDIPLNELGKLQALKTAHHFKENKFDLIITSPLVRAKETAEIIAKETDYHEDIIVDHSFIERNFGEADGKNVTKYIDLVHQNKVNGLETEQEIKSRMINGIINVCEKYKDKNIIIVCHSHSIKAVLAALEPEKYNFKTQLTNCSINLVEYKNKKLEVNRVNYNDYI